MSRKQQQPHKILLKPPRFDALGGNKHELDIIIKARAFSFNPKTNSYIIKLENAKILSQNIESNPPSFIFEIAPNKIHKASQTQLLHEDDIDAILDEIEQNEKRIMYSHSQYQYQQQQPPPQQAYYPSNTNNNGGNIYGGYHDGNNHNEYDSQSTYSAQRNYIKQNHLREESKQQIPTIQESNIDRTDNHKHRQNMDSLRSIPPIPSIHGRSNSQHTQNTWKTRKSYNKYRKSDPSNKHKPKMDKKRRELMSEWNKIAMQYKDRQCIQGGSMRHCPCIQRIKFMLKHYANWVKIRTTKLHQNGVGDDINVMVYYENISEFFDDLQYGSIDLSDDFEHIRDLHTNNNSSVMLKNNDQQNGQQNENEHIHEDILLDSVSQQHGSSDLHLKSNGNGRDTMEFFGVCLGKCDAKKCNILLRHCRDRDKIDNKQENKRRKLFFISSSSSSKDKDKEKDNELMLKEIYLETKLDIIHTALLHQQTNVMLLNKNKFITEIVKRKKGGIGGDGDDDRANDEDDTESKMEELPRNKEKEKGKEEESEIDDGREEEEDITIKLNNHGNKNKKKIMPFGESITYWDNKHHLFCKQKYDNLKQELLSNSLYDLSIDLFRQIEYFSIEFLKTSKGKQCIAIREHDWMKKYRISLKTQITVSHLIALFSYTNLSILRSKFIEYGYRHYYNHDTVSRQDLMIRHSELCHWSRLLLECVHCFGSPFNEYWRYYHGINCKLLFDRFNIMIDIPSSLTLDKDFAYTFSSRPGCGIMVELNHGTLSDLQSLCFDNSLISEFPFEEERFIFHSYVSIKDIVINGLHHDQWLKIFRFWYKLKEGFFFDHLIGTMGVTKNDQLCICAMIVNMMLGNENKNHPKYDQRIPYYMQCLFNECIQNKAFVWIIESEYVHLAPKLKSLLFYNCTNLNKSSQFIRYLVTEKKCNVCKCNTFKWYITDKLFQNLVYGNNEWIKSNKYKIYLYFNKDYAQHHCLSFHFECQDKPKNGLFRCRIHLDEFPKQISKVNLGIGVYADKVNIDNYSYAEIKCHEKLYNSSLHSLFPTKHLRKFHSLNLKLQIQLFYIHDQNGQLIKFQPV